MPVANEPPAWSTTMSATTAFVAVTGPATGRGFFVPLGQGYDLSLGEVRPHI